RERRRELAVGAERVPLPQHLAAHPHAIAVRAVRAVARGDRARVAERAQLVDERAIVKAVAVGEVAARAPAPRLELALGAIELLAAALRRLAREHHVPDGVAADLPAGVGERANGGGR